MFDSWKAAHTIVLLLIAVAVASYSFTGTFATNEKVGIENALQDKEIQLVAEGLRQEISSRNFVIIRDRIWKLEYRYACDGLKECKVFMPQTVYEEYRLLHEEKKELEEK